MDITRQSTVAEIATHVPATIRIFQDRKIDFCCGGKRPLEQACAERGLDTDALIGELRQVGRSAEPETDWSQAALTVLIGHIQQHYHEPLRQDLPWLGQMLQKVVSKHSDRHPETRALQEVFNSLHVDVLHHMQKEDSVLFPIIVGLEAHQPSPRTIEQPIAVMEHEHEETSQALARMRELTQDYAPPADACPTYRGLYAGLADLDRELRVHVHLENHVLFPRAADLAATVRQ